MINYVLYGEPHHRWPKAWPPYSNIERTVYELTTDDMQLLLELSRDLKKEMGEKFKYSEAKHFHGVMRWKFDKNIIEDSYDPEEIVVRMVTFHNLRCGR